MSRKVLLLLLAMVLLAAAPASARFELVRDDKLKAEILSKLKGDVNNLTLIRYDVVALAKSLSQGSADLPISTEKGSVSSSSLSAHTIKVRSDEHPGYACLVSGRYGALQAEKVTLSREQNYIVGSCGDTSKRSLGMNSPCGAISVLDEKQTMVQGIILDPDNGLTFVEPVGTIMASDQYEGLHIVYNNTWTQPMDLHCDVENPGPAPSSRDFQTSAVLRKKTNISLDCDAKFFNAYSSNVFSEMESIHLCVHWIMGLLEPSTDAVWGLSIPVSGHQAWPINQGPTTTDPVALSNEISSPSYTVYTCPMFSDTDIHYFFVGYNVLGVYGRACGVGTVSGGIGGASGKNHAFGEALTTQSLKTKWVVMAHMVGHLIGGLHKDGDLDGCMQGTSNCGPSLMLSASGGPPESRQPYFSSANDNNIKAVIGAYLEDWNW